MDTLKINPPAPAIRPKKVKDEKPPQLRVDDNQKKLINCYGNENATEEEIISAAVFNIFNKKSTCNLGRKHNPNNGPNNDGPGTGGSGVGTANNPIPA